MADAVDCAPRRYMPRRSAALSRWLLAATVTVVLIGAGWIVAMPPSGALGWIVTTSLAGGLLGVLAANACALATHPRCMPWLISYATGALLGAAFMEVLPHAVERAVKPEVATATVLGGILLFFTLEKLLLWRHSHQEAGGDARHFESAGGGAAALPFW